MLSVKTCGPVPDALEHLVTFYAEKVRLNPECYGRPRTYGGWARAMVAARKDDLALGVEPMPAPAQGTTEVMTA